jgi:hypothetical protein
MVHLFLILNAIAHTFLQVCPDGYYVVHAQCSVQAADVESSREELLHKARAILE